MPAPSLQTSETQELTHAFAPAERAIVRIAPARGGRWFALLMFLACHLWLAFARETPTLWALVSYALQQAIVWVAFVLIDERLSRRGAQFALACAGTLYATVTVLDGFLVKMTSLSLRESLPMLLASHHVVEGLREIGLKPIRVLILSGLLLGAAAAGGGMRMLFDRVGRDRNPRSKRSQWATAGLCLALPVAFVIEQTASRDQQDYLYRAFHMPGYVQLYSTSSRSVEVAVPLPISHDQRAKWLTQIVPARNPKHVLYVLLESFRADAVNPSVSPHLAQIAREGTVYEHALAEATYTPLSWSVLLFDEAAHDNLFGRHPGRPEPLGSWLLAVMRRAGYEAHVYVSTNLTYAGTRDRLLGPEPRTLDFFQAASDQGDDPADKNTNDRVAVDRLVSFIQKNVWEPSRPQFLLLQLDSTHYTYPFPEEHAVFKPFSENLAMPRAIETPEEAALLTNRYWNAAHYVDAQLGRVIAALKRAGVYDDTAIVVTADHGEGLRPGFQGHAAVFEETRHVPLILKLPGEAPSRTDQLISHRDILPTLAEYLQIAMPEGSTRGRSANLGPSTGVLTIAPSGRFGHFVTPEQVTELRLLYKPTSVTVTPSVSSEPASDWLPQLKAFLQPH